MNKTILSIIAISSFLSAPLVQAADFKAGESLNISDNFSEDSYMAGGQIRIDNSVLGDLFVVGGEIRIDSSVSEDVAVVGGDVHISGRINDDLRVAGGQVTIDATIDGDLLIAGGEVTIEKDARITGDVIIAAGQVTIYAPIGGDLNIHAGQAELNSSVGGFVEIYAEDVTLDGTITGNAKIVSKSFKYINDSSIKGDLEYWTVEREMDIDSIVAGSVFYNEDLGMSSNEKAIAAGGMAAVLIALVAALSLYKLLSTLLLISILVLTTKKYFPTAAKECMQNPWMSMLTGGLFIVLTPIVAILFMVTLIGIPIGFAIIAMYIVVLFFAKAFAAITLAQWYALRKKKTWKSFKLIGASVLVYALISIISIVPVLGWLAASALILMGIGACARTEYSMFLKVR